MCSRCWWWWYTWSFRWPAFEFSQRWSIFRWPEFDFSYWTTGWSFDIQQWLNFSIVDEVYWSVVTVLESVALASMLCYFFLFCGCTF